MGRRILSDAGYDVVTVNNGSAALKKIAENKPDLIVLDVYMPGYGGLEVCQRIKEAPETTRTPVLLTVGKLEPFKPEEARRVGADAFIIKPFEATELLTALTRLEDKIVAGPQPQKSGRFAKALAALEQSEVAQRFGDRETGWKNRLTIPPPQFKPKETETEDTEAIASRPSDLEEGQIVKPAEPRQEFERPIPAGLPADITPEEIAAITAAASAFGAKIEESSSPEAATIDAIAAGETVSSDTIANDLNATQPIDAEETEARSAPELREVSSAALTDANSQPSEGVSETVGSSESAETENHPPATELPAVAPQAESETEAPAIAEAQKPAGSDAEVMAAIASLAPTNGHATESMQAVPEGSYGIGHIVPNSPYSSGAAESSVTGPRWIAESVAVAVEESTLVLEHEMEQARAASAVLEAVNRRNEPTSSTLSVASSLEPEVSSESGTAAVES